MNKRVLIYVRVSTQEQAKEGYSIEEQIERLKMYCAAHDWIVIKIYTDAGYSGGNTDRPALKSMIADIKAGIGDTVLVYKLDRLSRSQKDTLTLIEDEFMARDVGFMSMSENFDTSSPFGRAMIGILAVFAQLEREQIKERMNMGREGRAKEGYYHGGAITPVGYDYIDGRLVVNEYERMQIREAYQLLLAGASYTSIRDQFNAKGYRNKYGIWKTGRVIGVLTNPLYIGYITFDGVMYEGQHEPIIDRETFEEVGKIVKARHEDFVRRRSLYGKGGEVLAGIIFCARCGARYGAVSDTKKGSPHRYRYYVCYSRRKSNKNMIKIPDCMNDYYRVEKLDNIIFDEIRKLAMDPAYLQEIAGASDESDLAKIEVLRSQVEKIEGQISRFMDLYGVGEFTVDQLTSKIKPLNEERATLQIEINALEEGLKSTSIPEVKQTVESFGEALERGNKEELKALIRSLIEYIEIDGQDITIHWRFE